MTQRADKKERSKLVRFWHDEVRNAFTRQSSSLQQQATERGQSLRVRPYHGTSYIMTAPDVVPRVATRHRHPTNLLNSAKSEQVYRGNKI